MYKKIFKRIIDFLLSLLALIVLFPVLLILTIIGTFMMKGNPFFIQQRPGKDERIFKLIKFRTMTSEKDGNGELLSDEKRLTKYGKFLRNTSLDELPELFDILVGSMAIVGPRPQLVRDMVFMTPEQRHRHDVRPGLSGLAQISGRNNIKWERKLSTDLEYIKRVTFIGDCIIVLKTIRKVLKREGIFATGMATVDDFGDELLKQGKIDQKTYDEKQIEAKKILGENGTAKKN